MILPAKKTLTPLIEEQKRQNAKAGLDLAKKVQALREELNQLTKNREEFIQGTLAEIEKITKAKWEEKATLEGEISILEAEKKKNIDFITCLTESIQQMKTP